MFSYSEALKNLKKSIPEKYEKKKDLEKKIDYCLRNIIYKAPELLPEIYSNYCLELIELLPTDNNKWAMDAWNIILEVANRNIEYIKNNIENDT